MEGTGRGRGEGEGEGGGEGTLNGRVRTEIGKGPSMEGTGPVVGGRGPSMEGARQEWEVTLPGRVRAGGLGNPL